MQCSPYCYSLRYFSCNCHVSRHHPLFSSIVSAICFLVAVQCTFICGSTRFKGIVGKSVSVRCLLSDRSLMRNLSWYKGNKKIVGSASYKIENRNKEFVLTIHKLSLKDAGDYVCSGFDMIMGNQFNNTVHLDLKNSRKICKYFLEV